MKSESFCYSELDQKPINESANLVFCGFDRTQADSNLYLDLSAKFPNADIVSFSTSGHFIEGEIKDKHPVVSSIAFDSSMVICKDFKVAEYADSYQLGEAIAKSFDNNIRGLGIISDGSEVNGTTLIEGVSKNMDHSIPVFGGMAGDGTRFEKTLVGLNEQPTNGRVIAIGFYGENIQIAGACNAGWVPVGMEFTITKSQDNVLMELNNSNPYDILYNLLKPENQEDFTKNTLYFPFMLELEDGTEVIRTPIAVDHENKTLTYAGNMPEGKTVKLMKSGTMQLLDSTMEAAREATNKMNGADFVFAVSCVGRRVVLDEMANEEYIELNSVFGDRSTYFGFYSYGEFFRLGKQNDCRLHNQTFTLAAISEK